MTYLGATGRELQAASPLSRFFASVAPRLLFPHSGRLSLNADTLTLEDWMEVQRHEIVDMSLGFDQLYTRWMAGGFGDGRSPKPSLLFGGEPLVIRLANSASLYLLVDRMPLTGITRNRSWYERLKSWRSAE